jgi:hypothetical protein
VNLAGVDMESMRYVHSQSGLCFYSTCGVCPDKLKTTAAGIEQGLVVVCTHQAVDARAD